MLTTLLELVLASALVLLPLAMLIARRVPDAVGRRHSALALQRSRLREVDRDLATGLIGREEHGAAKLEIERRLLAEADAAEPDAGGVRRLPLLLTMVLVPVGAVALYAIGGHPGLPPQPAAVRVAEARAGDAQDEAVIAELRAAIASASPGSARARQGEILLGQAEAAHGDWGASADAFATALADGPFDPALAMETAEARTRADGRVSPDSAALFKRAVATAPPDAPWRTMAEERIAQSEHAH